MYPNPEPVRFEPELPVNAETQHSIEVYAWGGRMAVANLPGQGAFRRYSRCSRRISRDRALRFAVNAAGFDVRAKGLGHHVPDTLAVPDPVPDVS